MDRDTVIALAQKAGLIGLGETRSKHIAEVTAQIIDDCINFASLVAAHEREACAKVCEETDDGTPYNQALECAAAIRSRTVKGSDAVVCPNCHHKIESKND